MKRGAVLTTALAMLVAGSAGAVEIRDLGLRPADLKPESYHLRLSFGSYCCGPNRVALARVAEHIEAASSPVRADRWNWGREGETDFGLTFRSKADRKAFVCQLAALRAEISKDPKARGPRPAFSILPEEASGQIKSCSQATKGSSAGGIG